MFESLFQLRVVKMSSDIWQITNAILVTPDGPVAAHGIRINGDIIESILLPGEGDRDIPSLNLHGLTLYPGLINGHDSLLATYHAYRGDSCPYINWLAWDNELKTSSLFRDRMLLDVAQLYALGGYKNLMWGATTVVDHIPEFVRKPFYNSLPVSLLKDFGIAHSACSYSLQWGEGISIEAERSLKNNRPFIIHIAEGFDRESRNSLEVLKREGGLNNNTVLVHGLSLNEDDIKLIARSGASLVWCPSANIFLYDSTPPIPALMNAGVPLILGTDSSMSGGVGLPQEISRAMVELQKRHGVEIHPARLFEMVTSNAARAFCLSDRGSISPGKRADILIVEGKYRDPYLSLAHLEPENIFLVTVGGKPAYADASLSGLFDELNIPYDKITVKGKDRVIVSGLKNLLDSVAGNQGQYKKFDFLPVDQETTAQDLRG